MPRVSHARRVLGLLAALLFALAQPAAAKSDRSNDAASGQDVMQALLQEVKQLRLALQKSVSFGPRVQLAFQRFSFQDQKVKTLSDQLTELRSQLSHIDDQATQDTEQLNILETLINQETDAGKKHAFSKELADRQRLIRERISSERDLRLREADLARMLDEERTRLDDLRRKLDELDRELTPAR